MKRIALLLALLVPLRALGADLPAPPCPDLPDPSYASAGAAPNVRVWHVDQWTPPACLGWDSAGSTLLVALAGSFRFAGSADDILARFGAVSTLRGVKDRSVLDQGWLPFITDASALASPDPAQRRADFGTADLLRGKPVYFDQRDSRSAGPVVYRMRVLDATPERVVVTVVNVTAIRFLLVSLFDPGDLQTTYFLQKLAPGVWGYYGLWGARTGMLTRGHDASSINRAVAVYRHFAGIPTDQAPPAAP